MAAVALLAGRIESVRAGRVREHVRPKWDRVPGATWSSAYVKHELPGAVRIGPLGLAGDEQFDRAVHGGPDKAVLAYGFDHYARWREELALPAMGPGGFAENLTVSALDERRVCVGDVFRTGSARLQVSQPRGPCANISRHWDRPDLLARVTASARGGWYLRTLEPGEVKRGDAMTLEERPCEGWTIERAFRVRVDPAADRADVAWLAACTVLSAAWRETLAQRLAR